MYAFVLYSSTLDPNGTSLLAAEASLGFAVTVKNTPTRKLRQAAVTTPIQRITTWHQTPGHAPSATRLCIQLSIE